MAGHDAREAVSTLALRTLIRSGMLIAMEGRPRAERADLLIDDGRICAVGRDLGATDCEIVDATDMIVLPGFVDTHRHTWQTQLRNLAADWTLLDYTVEMRFVYGGLYRAEDAYVGNYAGALEALDAGVTTLVDHSHIMNTPAHADEAIRALVDAGIRAAFCYGMYANPVRGEDGEPELPSFESPAWHFEDVRRVRARQLPSSSGLVTMGLALNEVEAFPVELARREIELARDLGLAPISVHVGMGALSRGKRFVARLNECGLLGPDLLFVHGASLDDDELVIAADAGASFSATPETEVQMGMGMPVAWRVRAGGGRASLGVDIVSNYGGDLFAQMRLALQVERARRNAELESRGFAPAALDVRAADVLEMATIGGARAAGLADRVGSLVAGKEADMILIRTDRLAMTPVNDPIAAVVLYANASDVDSVFVGGAPRKRSGRLVGVDAAAVRDRVVRSRDHIVERARDVDRGAARALVSSFFPLS